MLTGVSMNSMVVYNPYRAMNGSFQHVNFQSSASKALKDVLGGRTISKTKFLSFLDQAKIKLSDEEKIVMGLGSNGVLNVIANLLEKGVLEIHQGTIYADRRSISSLFLSDKSIDVAKFKNIVRTDDNILSDAKKIYQEIMDILEDNITPERKEANSLAADKKLYKHISPRALQEVDHHLPSGLVEERFKPVYTTILKKAKNPEKLLLMLDRYKNSPHYDQVFEYLVVNWLTQSRPTQDLSTKVVDYMRLLILDKTGSIATNVGKLFNKTNYKEAENELEVLISNSCVKMSLNSQPIFARFLSSRMLRNFNESFIAISKDANWGLEAQSTQRFYAYVKKLACRYNLEETEPNILQRMVQYFCKSRSITVPPAIVERYVRNLRDYESYML